MDRTLIGSVDCTRTPGKGRLPGLAKRRRIATDAAEVALWSWNVNSDEIALDEKAQVLRGVSKDSGLVTIEPGFGNKLVNKSVTSQLGESIAFEWYAEGLIVRLCMSKARLGA